jgi:4-phosphopantoate--beta-alanine ligase
MSKAALRAMVMRRHFAPGGVEISKDHPRYKSLMVRERMGEMVREGIVAPTGLIAHGRGEAFDYMIGERTTPEAERAEGAAVALLLEAKRPVITVNGNAAALAAKELTDLARSVSAKVEVNLFHWSEGRMEKVCSYVERQGGTRVLGRVPDAILPQIASDRAKCTLEGIYSADVVLIPLEDGDRALALKRMGKKVIAIDLNPLSRTALAADIAIVDELTRAIGRMLHIAGDMKRDPEGRGRALSSFNNHENLALTMEGICQNLRRQARSV